MKHYKVCCAIIENDNNEFFCCKRGPGRVLDGLYEFPGGKMELNESKEETIVREIKEELLADIIPIQYLGESHAIYSKEETLEFDPFEITLYCFRAKLIKGELTLTEHTEYKWLKKEELKKLNFAKADIPFIDKL